MQFDAVYDQLEDLVRATSEDEILAIMRKLARQDGYDYFIISGLPPRGINVEPFVMIADWPAEWYDRYFHRDYTQFDPVARHCFQTTLPFFWDEAPYDHADDHLAQRVMDEATEVGLKSGFCVPVHAEDGSQGCVSFGGANRDLNLENRMGLHLLSAYAHGRLRWIRRPGKLHAPKLTQREQEVLKWLARGKTYDDVGEVLKVSFGTIQFHVRNVRRKLGTTNTTHTVAEALRYGLITL